MIISKIKLHPFTYLVILISLLTGHFKYLLIFYEVLIVHELGHIIGGFIYKWEISKIVIMPFGLVTIFSVDINKPLKEEAIITILGPLFQIINFIIFKDINTYFNNINYGLFIFNMLPIYPLDGYKILKVFILSFVPFKLSLKISLGISLLFTIFFIRLDLIYIIIFILLFKGIINEYKNINYIYHKFLYERYIGNYHFKKCKIIKNINSLYKEFNNLLKIDRLYSEKEFLKKRFK